MKKFLLIFLSLILSNIVFSQYHKLIDTNKLWIESYFYDDVTDLFPGDASTFFSFFEGDTIINNIKYHKLYKQVFYSETNYINHTIDSTLRAPILHVLLREDTILKRVYDEHQGLLYDFSLNVGDTLNNIFGQYIVDSIAEIELNNGELRKKFIFDSFDNSGTENYYIEGIGGNNGLLEPFYYIGLSGYQTSGSIIYYSEDSVKLYGIGEYPNFITSVTSNKLKQEDISIYSNPQKDNIIIRNNMCLDGAVAIIDASGQILTSVPLKADQETLQIDIGNYKSGIYILTFESIEFTYSKKILKK